MKVAVIWVWIWLLAWPLKPEWLPATMQPEIRWDGGSFCLHGVACYSAPNETDERSVIHLNAECPHGVALDWQYFHEMQHHLQRESGIFEKEGSGEKFAGIVEDLVRSGRYRNEHQVGSMKGLLDQPAELHAELPRILKGEIPRELREWYPWFAPRGDSVEATEGYLFLTDDLYGIKRR